MEEKDDTGEGTYVASSFLKRKQMQVYHSSKMSEEPLTTCKLFINIVTFEPKPQKQDEGAIKTLKVQKAKSKEPIQEAKGLLQEDMLNDMKTAQFKNLGFSNVVGDKNNQQSTTQKILSNNW